MNCTTCEDSGYVFDTYHACTDCELGAPIQYEQDKDELDRLTKRSNTVRIKIKEYENLKGIKHTPPIKLRGLETA